MKHNKILLATALGTVLAMLAGCGTPSSQDSSSNNTGVTTGVKLSGTVVDGYVAHGTVYIDLNNNDSWEINLGERFTATTDEDGYFSYNPTKIDPATSAAGYNYCTSTVADDARYCLSANLIPNTDVVLRLFGGYDLTTGQPFKGELSRKVTVNADGTLPASGGLVITPLTTLTSHMTSTEANDLALSLGLSSADDLNTDFLADSPTTPGGTAISDTTRVKMVTAALEVQKFADAVGNNILTNSTLGTATDKPQDLTDSVYQAMATAISANLPTSGVADAITPALGSTSSSGGAADTIVNAAIAAAQADGLSTSGVSTTNLTNEAAALANATNSLFSTASSASSVATDCVSTTTATTTCRNDLDVRARAIEVITSLVRSDPTANASAITNAISWAQNDTNSYISSILQTVQANLKDVVSQFTAGTESTNVTTTTYANRPCMADNSTDATWLCGTSFAGTYLKASQGTNKETYFFFGAPGATSGTLLVCVTNSGDPNSAYNVTAAALEGTWSVPTKYSALIGVNFAGTQMSMALNSIAYSSTQLSSSTDTGMPLTGTPAPGDYWVLQSDFGTLGLSNWDAQIPSSAASGTGFFTAIPALYPDAKSITDASINYDANGNQIPDCSGLSSTLF